MIRQCIAEQRDWELLYLARSRQRAAFCDELWASIATGFTCISTTSKRVCVTSAVHCANSVAACRCIAADRHR